MEKITFRIVVLALGILLVLGGTTQAVSVVTDGLIRHFDASAIQGLSDGDPVSAWTDLSSNLDATAIGTPNYQSTGLKGMPAVQFEGVMGGANEYFELGDLSALTSGQVFIAFSRTYGTEPWPTWDYSGLWRFGTDQAVHIPAHAGPPPTQIYDSFGSSARKGPINIDDPSAYDWLDGVIYSASSADGLWTNVLNGVEQYSTASNTVSFETNALLGTSATWANTLFDGDIAELLIFDRVLSDSEEQAVGLYLQQKYDISGSYVPEPGTIALLALGTVLLRRKRRA